MGRQTLTLESDGRMASRGAGRGVGDAADGSPVLVDGHVHHYPCFDPRTFYDSAEGNFSAAAQQLRLNARAPRCLLLAETARERHFETLANGTPAAAPGLQIEPTLDPDAVRLTRGQQPPLIVIAGRQIVTREGIEILSLLTAAPIEERRPLAPTLDAILAAGGIAVLPWGFGKWWGSRGRLIGRMVDAAGHLPFFLGDNGGRAAGLPVPGAFVRAARAGVVILPGSDPLPLPAEASRPAGYGFVLDGAFDPDRPAMSLARLLNNLDRQPTAFGQRVGPGRFCRSQIQLRLGRNAAP